MEELFYELQQCYGSVRYRRSLESPEATDLYEVPHVQTSGPIPLQRVKPGAPPGGVLPGTVTTPPGTPQLRHDPVSPSAGQPILLTRRKDRKRTLPMDLGIDERSPAVTPTPAVASSSTPAPDPAASVSEPWEDDEEEDWTDIDVDGAGGVSGS
jgi:hypothetical protein